MAQPLATNQQGFALILTMVMLLVLSVLGVMVLNSTDTELRITGNTRAASDAFVATGIALEFATHKVLGNPSIVDESINLDLINSDAELSTLLANTAPGVQLDAGANEVDFYTGQPPIKMQAGTATDAYLGNTYRISGNGGSQVGGAAPYYHISLQATAHNRAVSNIQYLFVNRGSQVY